MTMNLRYWKTPIGITLLAIVAVALRPSEAFGVFPLWLVCMIGWMAWSMVSGLYPWSMRI